MSDKYPKYDNSGPTVDNTWKHQSGGDCNKLPNTACSTPSTPRKIKVEFYVEAFGETFTKEVEIVSPPVSNMPDPQIQASADFAVARQYLNTFHQPHMGVTIL